MALQSPPIAFPGPPAGLRDLTKAKNLESKKYRLSCGVQVRDLFISGIIWADLDGLKIIIHIFVFLYFCGRSQEHKVPTDAT